jgi:hypothetical protein
MLIRLVPSLLVRLDSATTALLSPTPDARR